MSDSRKFRQKLWTLCLIIGVEIVVVWLAFPYFISQDYQPLVKTPDLSQIQPSIPLATDDLAESDIESLDYALKTAIFSLGTSSNKILQTLGEPVWRKPGFWENSIAWSYQDIVFPGVDLGYIFDSQTNRLRQAEIAVPPSINLDTLQLALESLLGESTTSSMTEGLQAVYQYQQDTYDFRLGNKKCIIQRNSQHRIYIAVWEADFH